MATVGYVDTECPVCHKAFRVCITTTLVKRNGRPGQAKATVRVHKPIRIPREHRDCIEKVT